MTMLINSLKTIAGACCLLLAANIALAGEAAKVTALWGQVEINGKPAKPDQLIQENATIKTAAQSYVYLKTVDDGFLIVRPNSEAKIVEYQIDAKNPENTRIKLELVSGVARSVSGNAVKLARQNFRFNTPVAAIGVRGTDFTVFADQQTTRVAVVEGGVVVSPFDQACLPSGKGPCEGSAAAELFAKQQGVILMVSKGQGKTQVLQNSGTLAPDTLAPPAQDEPNRPKQNVNAGNAASTAIDANLDPNRTDGVKKAVSTAANTDVGPKNTIVWGRWVEVLGQKAEVSASQQVELGNKVVELNKYYALFLASNAEWQMPKTGVMAFSLQDYQAVIHNPGNDNVAAAKLENGYLSLNFANASYATGFDLVSGAERFNLKTSGAVLPNGYLQRSLSFMPNESNMLITGALTSEAGGSAAYIFSALLDKDSLRVAHGITKWQKK